MRQQNTKATVPLDVVPERRTERCSPIFRPGGRFWGQFSDSCRRAGREEGREMSVPRPYVTDPFLQPSSIYNTGSNWYIYTQRSSYFLHVVYSSVPCGASYLTIAHVLLQKHSYLWFRAKSCVFPYGAQNT